MVGIDPRVQRVPPQLLHGSLVGRRFGTRDLLPWFVRLAADHDFIKEPPGCIEVLKREYRNERVDVGGAGP
jgi:hypothetical protein